MKKLVSGDVLPYSVQILPCQDFFKLKSAFDTRRKTWKRGKTEEKKVDSPEEMRLHSKEARGLRDSVGEENLMEKQVDRTIESQHFIQYQPSAPPQPKMDQV